MGGFTAQVQSPQTTGGKGNPVSDSQLPPPNGTSGNVLPRNVSNPGPAGLTILGSNDAMPQGKGAGGGVGAMAPGTYDPSVRRVSDTSAVYNPAAGGPNYQAANDPMQNNVSRAIRPEAGGPNMQPQGKGAASTNSATSGQPRIGQPNNYANTVGGWDNASIQPQRFGGKGKGS